MIDGDGIRCPGCGRQVLDIMHQATIEDDGQVGELPVLCCGRCWAVVVGRYDNGAAVFPAAPSK